jgi:hypothetical protein
LKYLIIFVPFLLVLLVPQKSQAAISHIAADCTGTSSCTTTGNATGDTEVAIACRDGSATAPTTATGWTSMGTGTINGTGSADSACRAACKVTTGTNEASNTFTNATAVQIMVYRGQATGTTATCATAVWGTPSFFTSTVNTTTTTETFNSITASTPGSWVVGMGYAPAATAGMGTAPTGMTNRVACASCTSSTSGGGHDTNGIVASFSSANVTITTASRIITFTAEVKVDVCVSTAYTNFTCKSFSVSSGATDTTATCSFTTAAGDLIIGMLTFGSSETLNSFLDNNSVTPTQTYNTTHAGVSAIQQAYYEVSGGGTETSLTATFSASSHGLLVCIIFTPGSGKTWTTPLDKQLVGTSFGSSPTSGNVTTTQANEVLIGDSYCNTSQNCSFVAGSNYSRLGHIGNTGIGVDHGAEFREVTATGTYAATFTATSNANAAISTFYLTTSAGSTTAPRLPLLGVGKP